MESEGSGGVHQPRCTVREERQLRFGHHRLWFRHCNLTDLCRRIQQPVHAVVYFFVVNGCLLWWFWCFCGTGCWSFLHLGAMPILTRVPNSMMTQSTTTKRPSI